MASCHARGFSQGFLSHWRWWARALHNGPTPTSHRHFGFVMEEGKDEGKGPDGAPDATEDAVVLKKFHAVGLWSFNVGQVDQCAICLNSLTERCIECAVDLLRLEDCGSLLGFCNHEFHAHCINKFLRSRPDGMCKCPMCQVEWDVQRVRSGCA
jgi:E3 ubiquitin-protein ligase RBX1